MDVLKESPSELDMGTTSESFGQFLDSQRELFHNQVDHLQNIVVRQCKLTGVNPLSQEMAAGALSVKIGKRPRDLLNPKAVKYMQSVFSIKDAISKKESREISALFSVTVTQVRDFFASQRSRVRKFVRLSREKAVRSNSCKEPQDGTPVNADPLIPIAPVPLNSVGPGGTGEAPSCSTHDEALPGIDDSEKHFVDNIFNFMRKEESFSGQVKLMEWILTLQNSSVLSWFLSKGGVMILATWLSQAATEEQTSVLLVILKVLCHLPLHKALPVHMSAILQSVNKLRFYRTQDISNRARVLLSRWSKIFVRSQAMKKPNATKSSSDMHNELLLKQSIGEIMDDESWQSKADLSEDRVAPLYEISEKFRKLESPPVLKLLPASSDDSNRKHNRGVSMTPETRERRKVQLVEQPGQKTLARSLLAVRAVPVSQGRPMSADDIQKAKMRAVFRQNKYGKIASASSGSCEAKTEGLIKPSFSQNSILLLAPRAEVQHPKNEERRNSPIAPSKISDQLEGSLDLKRNLPLQEIRKRVQIPWHTPPEMRIHDLWRVGAAENSKEVEVQKNRLSREKETVYPKVEDIPPEPREPWEVEMDYDDSLTPKIPTEQLPDADGTEPSVSPCGDENGVVTSAAESSHISNLSAPEPDLELLAVLLKNPELVFSLTSGQGGGLSSEETVKLLDMIKTGAVCLPGSSNGSSGIADERVEVSLPSPTPSSNPTTSGWRPETVKNPFTQRDSKVNRTAHASLSAAFASPAIEKLPATNGQSSTAKFTLPQFQPTVSPLPQQQLPAPSPHFSMPQSSTLLETRPPSRGPSLLHQSNPTNSPVLQIPALNMNSFSVAYSNPMPVTNVKTSPVSITLNTTDRLPTSLPRLPVFSLPPSQSQIHLQHSTLSESSPVMPYLPTSHFEKPGPVPDFWRNRQSLASNPASQANERGYGMAVRGPAQPQVLPGHWERGDFAMPTDFQTWSPEGSPTRPPLYVSGRNLSPQPRIGSGRYHRPDQSQQRNSSGYRDHNRYGDRGWRDRGRERDRRR